MWELGRASDNDALRLVVAFLQIHEPERRLELIKLAEYFQSISERLPRQKPALSQDNYDGRRNPFRRS